MLLTHLFRKLLILASLFGVSGYCSSQTKIHCQITSTDASSDIYYFKPFNGYYNDIFIKNPIHVIDDTFSIVVDEGCPGFIVLYLDVYAFYIGVSGCDTIKIKADYRDVISGKSKELQYEGKNAQGHALLNQLYFEPMEKYTSVHDLLGKATFIPKELLFDSLQRVIDFEIRPFKTLYLSGGIDYTYYRMSTTSIKSAMLTEFLKPFNRKTSISKRFTDNEINRLLKQIFREYNPADPYYAVGIRSYIYTADYKRYIIHDVLADKTVRNRMVDSLIQGDSQLLPIEDFIPYLLLERDGFREHIWGSQLYLVKRLFPEEVPISDLRAFRHFYPNSLYLPFLSKLYERDIALNSGLAEGVIIVDSFAALNDFKTLAQTIQDSSNFIFIDLWASWCVPCKEQFEFNQKLDTLLERYRISKVYVAIDQLLTKKSWLNDIKRYKLLGRHYIANDRFKLFLQHHVFKEGEDFSIPRYILLDRSGAILNSNVARPSSFGLLERQLRQFVTHD